MTITLCKPALRETVCLLPADQRALRQGARVDAPMTETVDWRNPSLDGTERSYPLPVEFRWHISPLPTKGTKCALHLSVREDFAEETVLPASNRGTWAENLLIGQKYFWKVALEDEDGRVVESETGCFETEGLAPRLLRVDGLTNVRDMGGWRTVSGRRVRQGLLYRGSEMDTHQALTVSGRRTMREVLRIRTDLDLRGEAVDRIEKSPLGGDVELVQIPVYAYGDFFEPGQYNACWAVFRALAERENYPIYMHCWGGADRTGTLALVIGALLGMEDEDLIQDYELTSFAIWGKRFRSSELFEDLLAALARYGAKEEPLRVKVRRYLLAADVTEARLDAVCDILLE